MVNDGRPCEQAANGGARGTAAGPVLACGSVLGMLLSIALLLVAGVTAAALTLAGTIICLYAVILFLVRRREASGQARRGAPASDEARKLTSG